MKTMFKTIQVICLCLFPILLQAQFTVVDLGQATMNLNQLAAGFAGGGLQITNITNQGTPQQIGYFNGITGTGLSSGVILSTGDVNDANQANLIGSTSTNFNGGGDADLSALVGGLTTNDAVVFEIDFVPFGDTVVFNYVFASEEYPEYVNSSFNDVFAFFVSSPTMPMQNIALIPGTTMPVAINNVNSGLNSSYYVTNTSNQIEYDGYTTPMTATVALIPNQTYTLKIAIADVSDHVFDSAVLLEFGSFSSFGSSNFVSGLTTTPDLSGVINEGCLDGAFTFFLQDSIAYDTTINYSIIGTAQNGVDYQTITDSVTIPAGQLFGSVIISPTADATIEGMEDVSLVYQNAAGNQDTLTMYITEPILPELMYSDTVVCQFDTLTMGYTNYNPSTVFSWQPNNVGLCANCPQNYVNTYTSSAYLATYATPQGCFGVDTVLVTVIENPIPTVTCQPMSNTDLQIYWTANSIISQAEINVNGMGWTSANSNYSHLVSGLTPGSSVSVEVRCYGVCSSVPSYDSTFCTMPSCALTTNGIVQNVSCYGANDGGISVSIAGGSNSYQMSWSNGATTTSISNLSAGAYAFNLYDSLGCSTSDTFYVNEPTPIMTTITVIDDIANASSGSATATATGGVAPYTYTWGSGNTNLAQGTYSLTTTDANNCSSIDSFYVDNLVGTDGIINESSIEIYPNPANDFVNVRLSLDKNYPVQLKIFSVDGRLMQEQNTASSQLNNLKISTTDLPNGMYTIQIIIENQLVTKRLMIQK